MPAGKKYRQSDREAKPSQFREMQQAAFAAAAENPEKRLGFGVANRIRLTLGPGGRVVIPAALREAMEIEEGDTMLAWVEDGELHLLSPRVGARQAQEMIGTLMPSGVSLADELIDDRRRKPKATLMASLVFDSSVVLAHLNKEQGSEKLAGLFGEALISSVNLSEIFGKLIERGARLEIIRAALSRYGMQTVDFDQSLAERTGVLRSRTKEFGLSLGDRACIALGEARGLPVLTADRAWAKLDLPVEIRLIR